MIAPRLIILVEDSIPQNPTSGFSFLKVKVDFLIEVFADPLENVVPLLRVKDIATSEDASL